MTVLIPYKYFVLMFAVGSVPEGASFTLSVILKRFQCNWKKKSYASHEIIINHFIMKTWLSEKLDLSLNIKLL